MSQKTAELKNFLADEDHTEIGIAQFKFMDEVLFRMLDWHSLVRNIEKVKIDGNISSLIVKCSGKFRDAMLKVCRATQKIISLPRNKQIKKKFRSTTCYFPRFNCKTGQ